MARFLDEEFGPPMLLRAARAVLEAQSITEALGSTDDAPPGRDRLRELILQLEETAQLHHWAEEDDILAELGELSVRLGEGAESVAPAARRAAGARDPPAVTAADERRARIGVASGSSRRVTRVSAVCEILPAIACSRCLPLRVPPAVPGPPHSA